MIIELLSESNFCLAAADVTHQTAGVIISVRMIGQIEPQTIEFGRIKNVSAVKRFAISIVQIQ